MTHLGRELPSTAQPPQHPCSSAAAAMAGSLALAAQPSVRLASPAIARSSRTTIPPAGGSSRPALARPAARRAASDVTAAAAVKLAGVGSSVPEKFLTNDDLAQLVDTNDEWITTRTGIKKRHILAEGESLGDHAAAASRRALEMAGGVAGTGRAAGRGSKVCMKGMASDAAGHLLVRRALVTACVHLC